MTAQCDGHDAPASLSVHWVEFPRTEDERGRALGVCESPECLARVLGYVESAGEFVEFSQN